MSRPKIFIGLPCGELSRFSLFWGSFHHVDFSGLEVFMPEQYRSAYIDNNQNELARIMHQSDADYFWLLNDDLVFLPDTLKRLVAHGKDLVVPIVLNHDPPLAPLFYEHRIGDEWFTRHIQDGETGLIQGIGAGGGGMLISRAIFDAFPDPWWETHMIREAGIYAPRQSTEDFDFCNKVTAAGFDIWCDLDCRVGHLTVFTVWPIRREDGTWAASIERNGQHIVVDLAKPQRELEALTR
jgi:hypothetical protein